MILVKVPSQTDKALVYSVAIDGDKAVCNCKGYVKYSNCKHVSMIKFRAPRLQGLLIKLIDFIKLNQPTIETKQDLVAFVGLLELSTEDKLILNTFRHYVLTTIWKMF